MSDKSEGYETLILSEHSDDKTWNKRNTEQETENHSRKRKKLLHCSEKEINYDKEGK